MNAVADQVTYDAVDGDMPMPLSSLQMMSVPVGDERTDRTVSNVVEGLVVFAWQLPVVVGVKM